MQPSYPWARKLPPELGEYTSDLLRDSLQALLWTVGGMLLIWLFAVGLRWPELLYWQFWVVSFALIVTIRLTVFLLKERPFQAGLILLVGLAMTNVLMILLFERPELVIFFALFPLITVVMMDWQAGLLSEAGVLLLLWGFSRSHQGAALELYYPVTAFGSLVCGLLGWINRQTLLDTISRSAHYATLAQQNLEETRQHRAQLVNALKNLDLAYYRLERANAALVSAWKQAEDAERFKSEFVTYVSHEMRTPLNLIAGFSETVLTAPESYGGIPLSGQYREDIHKIWRNAQHLLKLVDDVIDLAKVNVGRISLAREMVDLNGLVVEAVGMLRDYIHVRGLEIQLDLAKDLPLVWIDRLRILQVLLNLLVNAVRFTEKGWIRISTSSTQDEVVVSVIDSGRGISEEDLPRVFEEFRTTGQPGEAWHGGGGLGLPISKKMIELHQGTMGVKSQPTKGSSFWFTLPLTHPPPEAPLSTRPYTAQHFRPKAAERTLVVAHHDRYIVPVLQRYLEGYRVLPARSLEEAAEIAGENQAIALLASSSGDFEKPQGDWITIRCPLPDWRDAYPWTAVRDILRKPVSAEALAEALARIERPVERLLLVDDDPDMIDLLRRMLATRFTPDRMLEAGDGLEALQKINETRPDLVLLDLALPGMNGREILARLAADSDLAAIPVIVISGNVEDYSGETLCGTIEISRQAGFQFGEVIQALGSTLAALTPGWDLAAPPAPVPPTGTGE
jgi:signal transduction histidine kinase/CheY-like chemotaxis protein